MNNLEYKKDVLYMDLKKNIQAGAYTPGYQFPKELELAKQLNVARVTVRTAFAMLEEDGLIKRIKGRGTFVASGKNRLGDILIIVGKLGEFANPSIYLLEGINKAASINNVNVRVCERPYIESFSPEGFAKSVAENNISGILLPMGYFHGKEYILDVLNKSGVPVVMPHALGSDYNVTGFACVQVDQRAAWEDAVAHLAESGHRRIATLVLKGNPDLRGHTVKGHFELLEKYGASTELKLMETIDYDKKTVLDSVNKWLDMSEPPTAILCYSDFLAIYVYEVLKERGLRIPEDAAVMGCCGYPGASIMDPPLSTVDFEYRKMGEAAVELLMNADSWFPCELNITRPRVMKKHVLIKRESTNIKVMESVTV